MTEATLPTSPQFSPERLIIAAGLIILSAISWAYLLHMSADACCIIPSTAAWHAGEVWMLVVMWTVMMVAMMVPSFTPTALMFATVQRQRRTQDQPYVPTALFLLGYLLIWAGFSVAAAAAQVGLHKAALLSPEMVSTSPVLGGVVLIATGIFQFTPLKRSCLGCCRSPLQFLLTEWRDGRTGAIVMGLRQGIFCTGCCWLLMVLLFVVGVMNLLWVAALTALVLAEKIVPGGFKLAQIVGVAMIGWGGILLVRFLSSGSV